MLSRLGDGGVKPVESSRVKAANTPPDESETEQSVNRLSLLETLHETRNEHVS